MEAVGKAAAQAGAKAAEIARRPVFGRKRTLTYKTTVERDGVQVEAEVKEESSAQIGSVGTAIVGVAAALGLGAVATALSSTTKRLRRRDE